MVHGLFLDAVKFSGNKLNGTCQILAAVLQFALHLTAARKIVADDCLVVGVEGVGVLGLNHDLVGLEQALHASLPL